MGSTRITVTQWASFKPTMVGLASYLRTSRTGWIGRKSASGRAFQWHVSIIINVGAVETAPTGILFHAVLWRSDNEHSVKIRK
jgi:hypothetical protein